eukprot:TRINITY_DN2290_c0_g1_i4.p2 TRINITY_DN2290_c0_g1~~TRINITY_DN2290_c0_g1_i4.p2  ORF type:complete len:120 (-),score=7.25 TRINITY_DN2290_c0_g1_i4:81-440(-)
MCIRDRYAIDQLDGSFKWYTNLHAEVLSSPVIGPGGTVYVGAKSFSLFALNPYNGTEIWRYHTGGFINSSPALYNGILYVASHDRYLYAVSESGIMQWRYFLNRTSDSLKHLFSLWELD